MEREFWGYQVNSHIVSLRDIRCCSIRSHADDIVFLIQVDECKCESAIQVCDPSPLIHAVCHQVYPC